MTGMLAITLRFLEGRYHGNGSWPPAPARLFQALVAGAAPGERLPEPARAALSWLERLSAPAIAAPSARRSGELKLFVPNNDVDAKLGTAERGYAEAVASVRTDKRERPWLFDDTQPLFYLWELPPEEPRPTALPDVVHGLYRLGRGTDHAFATMEVLETVEAELRLQRYPGAIHRPGPGSQSAVPCPGTLKSLEQRHAAFIGRFSRISRTDGRLAFRQPPKPQVRLVGYDVPPHRLVYHIRRSDPGAAGRFRPVPLTTAAVLTHSVLREAAQRLRDAMPDNAPQIDRQVLGRGAGEADKHARIRLIPLPSSGHEHADLAIRRLLLEVPAMCKVPVEDLDWAFGNVTPCDLQTGEVQDWRLERDRGRDNISDRFTSGARCWRSLTPLALPQLRCGRNRRVGGDRRKETEAAAAAVQQALRHAGVRQKPEEIAVRREPFRRRGARAEIFAVPDHLARSRLAHVEIRFATRVKGPLILGDGRYRGLGLMEPVHESDVFLFSIGGDNALAAEPVAQAARRAIMALAAGQLRQRSLPVFFAGHDADGAPSRTGKRAHLAVLVDPGTRHLVVATPQALDRRPPEDDERSHTRTLESALGEFHHLVAGRSGAFTIMPVHDPEAPLLRASQVWESVTDWRPGRHGKGDSGDWISGDIRRDCALHGLPVPEAVEVLRRTEGRRGGLRARLRLHFAHMVTGPLCLGRTAMKGGGVFVAKA